MELSRRITRELTKKLFNIDPTFKRINVVNPQSDVPTLTPLLSTACTSPSQTNDTNDIQCEDTAKNNADIAGTSSEPNPDPTSQRGDEIQGQGSFQLNPTTTDNMEESDLQIVPLPLKILKKRNFSFDMGVNRWERPNNKYQQLMLEGSQVKLVSVSKTPSRYKRYERFCDIFS